MCQLTIMNLDASAGPKKHSILLTLKNSTKTDLKLHGYVSSASPSSQLPNILSHSNKNAPNNLEFELSRDSNHGIWLRYRYVGNEARGFDVRICESFSKTRGTVMSTDVYYIDGQDERKILSREAVYTMRDSGGTTRYQVNDGALDENVERENNSMFSARVRYDIVNADGWDLYAFIEVQFLMTETP
jgi:hypothetical protein